MNRHMYSVCVTVVGLAALLAAAQAGADDRDLLRAEGAPANVLVILDSGASMTHDPMTNSINFLASGDDRGTFTDFIVGQYGWDDVDTDGDGVFDIIGLESRFNAGREPDELLSRADIRDLLEQGSKLVQAKTALDRFFDAGFAFNFGFSFYEKTAISVHHLNFIYRVMDQELMDGTPVGGLIRMGSKHDARVNNQDGAEPPDYPVRYGRDGDQEYVIDWNPFGTNTGTPTQPENNDVRFVSFLVDGPDVATAKPLWELSHDQRRAGKLHYWPAYDWEGLSTTRLMRAGMEGAATWAQVADWNFPGIRTLMPERWQKVVHDYALADITYVGDPWGAADLEAWKATATFNDIGSKILYIKEMYQQYQNDAQGWRRMHPNSSQQVTRVEYAQHFVLYDHDPPEQNPGPDTLSAVGYQGTADCAGYLDTGSNSTPIVPLSVPSPGDGSVDDNRWKIRPYLKHQPEPVYYFPGHLVSWPYGGDTNVLPTVREGFIPLTDSVIAIGRRPIKDSINEAKTYYDHIVDEWCDGDGVDDDPLCNCRQNFVIIITDGVETCSNLNAPCSAAANIDVPVYVIYFGSPANIQAADENVIKCVGDESGGTYFQAADEQALTEALLRIAQDIEERTRGFASPIVPSVETSSEQTAYISTFTPADLRTIWRGHLRAYAIDPRTGVIAGMRCVGNGVLDPGEDLDGDGVLDPSEDTNGNGVLDPGEDTNGNGVLDPGEDRSTICTPNPLYASWDAGDILALRCEPPCPADADHPSDPRTMYYSAPGADMPGDRNAFVYGSTIEERAELGLRLGFCPVEVSGLCSWSEDVNGDGVLDPSEDTNCNGVLDAGEDTNGNGVLDPGEDLDCDGLISEPMAEDLLEVVNFIRGVPLVVDANTGEVITHGRDTDHYGWCNRTDIAEGTQQPCQAPDAALRGVEKMGDIFHSTPQLMGSPRCYTCWLQNYASYRDDTVTPEQDDGFLTQHRHRRQVLFSGADDGTLHAFEAGLWDIDGYTYVDDQGETVEVPPRFDKGTGRELFAWVPDAVMHTLPELATGLDHKWTVDATPSVVDALIDHEFEGAPSTDPDDLEWRTLLLFGQRRGGRSIVCLDVTQPDSYSGGEPEVLGDITLTQDDLEALAFGTSRDPLCVTDSGSCAGDWPEFRWEFTDGLSEETSSLHPGYNESDLGATWSRPLVGFVDVEIGGSTLMRTVAFFGGGYTQDEEGLDAVTITGNWVYGVDVETGNLLLKVESEGMVPGELAALDLNLDGKLEMLYWGDTDGNIYHMDVTSVGTLGGNGRIDNWTPVKILDVGPTQPFFMRPTLVPVSFNADGSAIIAVTIGSGNRDDILEANDPLGHDVRQDPHRFYVFVDAAPAGGYPITEAPGVLMGFDHTTIADAAANYLQGSSYSGWYLEFADNDLETNDWEKVNTAAVILNQYVIFSTFNPDSDVEEVVIPDPNNPEETITLCRRGGNARTYVIYLFNGNPPEGESLRYIQHPPEVAMATEPVIYLGADGMLHVIQALDNLQLQEPVAAVQVPVRVMTWKEE